MAKAVTRALDYDAHLSHGEADAGLAQLVEQRFCKPKVAGSIPALGTITAPNPRAGVTPPQWFLVP